MHSRTASSDRISLYPKHPYIPEVDGIRALAVAAVIVNHINASLAPSGYVGVDVFFVISGFVVARSLSTQVDSDASSFFISFYSRRIKRLIPALSFMVFAVILLSLLFLREPRSAIITGTASLLGFSNIYLAIEGFDYFASDSHLNPFLHTWSLGVEEQIYFLMPFFAFKFFRAPQALQVTQIKILSFFIAMSLISFIYVWKVDSSFAYYISLFRIWEVALGAFVFILDSTHSKPPLPGSIYNFTFSGSLACVIGLFFAPIHIKPVAISIAALTTTLLLYSLTHCLRSSTCSISRKLLNATNIRAIGKRSYSIYLWHWPLIVFYRIAFGLRLSMAGIAVTVLLAIILTLASYSIELAIRHGSGIYKSFMIWTPTLAFGLLLTIFVSFESNSLFRPMHSLLNRIHPLFQGRHSADHWTDQDLPLIISAKCPSHYKNCTPFSTFSRTASDGGGNFFVIGDSHAMQASFMLSHLPFIHGSFTRFKTSYISLDGDEENSSALLWDERPLSKSTTLKKLLGAIRPGDFIFIAFHAGRFNDMLNEHSQSLVPLQSRLLQALVSKYSYLYDQVEAKGGTLILMKDTPLFGSELIDVNTCHIRQFTDSEACSTTVSQIRRSRFRQDQLYDTIRKYRSINIWDPLPYLAHESRVSAIRSDGSFIMRDSNHVTRQTAQYLAYYFSRWFFKNYGGSKSSS
jgi:peptidoglycan/LPS O-acetylase OafA/YrhL